MKLFLIDKGLWDMVSRKETLAEDADTDTKSKFTHGNCWVPLPHQVKQLGQKLYIQFPLKLVIMVL